MRYCPGMDASVDAPIVTAQLRLPASALREPTEAELRTAQEQLEQLEAEARGLGELPAAAPVHYAMGRVWIERLGDPRSAATCFQNAFRLDPRYRPNLEAARRLFASEGRHDRALALHEREEQLLPDPAAKAESLRAQARILARELHQPAEAAARVQQALQLQPDHPALLQAAVESAAAQGDRALSARLLLRSAKATKDDVQRALLLRRAVLLLEELIAEAQKAPPPPNVTQPPVAAGQASPAELDALLEEALRRLHGADASDPVAVLGLVARARAKGAWDEVTHLYRAHADRTEAPADRLLVAQLHAYKLGHPVEALAEVQRGLEKSPADPALRALLTELTAAQRPDELPALLAARAADASEASERADLRIVAAASTQDPLAREQLLSEALAENPGDAAAIALHARLVALRDATSAAERFVALGEALEGHVAEEAASHFTEAALWAERAGQRAEAAALARRALGLAPHAPAALRTLMRTLPLLGGSAELARLLEEAAAGAQPPAAAELLSRAASLLSDLPAQAEIAGEAEGATQVAEVPPMQRALDLAQRAAELARGLSGARWMENWTLLALRAGDLGALGRSLEQRGAAATPSEAAELLLEAAEVARVAAEDARALELLRRARAADPEAAGPRRALLAIPTLPVAERLDLLAEEAKASEAARAAALWAERAALLESEGRVDEAVQACALALSTGGVDPAVLRRMARLQLRRGELKAALEVLAQLALALPEGTPRAETLARAAEVAEWRLHDPDRACDLQAEAAAAAPGSAAATSALAARTRLLLWHGRWRDAADAAEEVAQVAKGGQKLEALRLGASLRANRTGEGARAAELYRRLLAEEPGDLESTAALLALDGGDTSSEARRERAELRARLASRCQDPRLAALLRADSADDRLAAGERDQGVAEYRRALALNPHDRTALDLVEEALRSSRQSQLLAEHLAFRCAYEDGATRAALSLQQAELFAEAGQLEKAMAGYKQALQSEPGSLLAVRGARRIAEQLGDRTEVMRLLAREAGLSHDPGIAAGSLIEAALLAEDLGEKDEAAQHLSSVLEYDPKNDDVARRLRGFFGDNAPHELAQLYQRVGAAHADDAAGAAAWLRAGRVQLDELRDAQSAYVSAGRALARQPDSPDALELRADAAEAGGRWGDAADALQRRLGLPVGVEALIALRQRLAGLLAERLNEPERALALVADQLEHLPVSTLVRLAPAARALEPRQSARLYRRLLEAWPDAVEGGPPKVQIAEWTDEYGRATLALGEKAEALAAFRRAWAMEPRNRAALEHVAELSAEHTPGEAIASYRQLLDYDPPRPELIRALVPLFQRLGRPDAAFCAAAALVGLGAAGPSEKALYEEVIKAPPPADLPQVGDAPGLRSPGDQGAVRALLDAAAAEVSKALPTELTGRGDRVKGDNPVRRICAALSRALGMQEPALYVAKGEPAVVLPVAGDPSGLLVGTEVPRRFVPRQQRFLYGRALAALRRGTHPLWALSAARLEQLVAELLRLCAPVGTDLGHLPPLDVGLSDALGKALPEAARAKLSPLAAQAASEPPAWEALRLALRETAERAGMALAGDPAAALGLVSLECPGGLSRPEVARLARFAVSEEYFALRVR